ncbi:glycosyl hydrolase [Proteiniphilum sp.]|uniref:glycosyl hydrolase n=1 Tax=Proteiniphilum sp. TaxID=1926877 RepID=UPI002B2202D8|nr:glycosyl hydrolase [Proteiniphilum sp.]MEA4917994.1 glycosyl hydrolase [Proteiniphilum sp.]
MKPTYAAFLGILALIFLFTHCGDDGGEDLPKADPLKFLSTFPENGATNVSFQEKTIILTFGENIKLIKPHGITFNGGDVANASALLKELKIVVTLEPGKTYNLIIPAGKLEGRDSGGLNSEITLSFSTATVVKPALVITNPSSEARKVYDFLYENFEKKIISGAMANVAWNINEAEWVYRHTGKYPALNSFDYIHLHESPASWINYENIEVVENWWNNNGLVAAMWHWNVPASEGSSAYHFYTKDTSFDVSKATVPGTFENRIVKDDLEKIADNLLLLKTKNIPVIWRPLHEASGRWFWWGAKGADACKKLWIMMFETFEAKGLNNLIWVWTSQTNDHDWYPGDKYVDIIGRDAYDKTSSAILASEYKWLKETYPNKIIALSEFGNAADLAEQWENGVKWSWMMPWYDYNRTVNISGSEFDKQTHTHANIAYWQKVLAMDEVVTRDEMPDLKK